MPARDGNRYTTPQKRISELVKTHGSYRKLAKYLNVDHSYLYRVAKGEKRAGDELLSLIGLERHVVYTITT